MTEMEAHEPELDKAAEASLWYGLFGVFVWILIPSIIAVIAGHLALARIYRSGGLRTGKIHAIGGLLLGYAVIIVFILVMVPLLRIHIFEAKVTDMKTNGASIYLSVYADARGDNAVGFPAAGTYQTSTDYFKALRPVVQAEPDFFGGPHVKTAKNWSNFSGENSAWRVVEGLSLSSDAGTPFLISSNVKSSRLSELTGRIDATIDPESRLDDRVMVGYFGGGVSIYMVNKDPDWRNQDWPDLRILPQ